MLGKLQYTIYIWYALHIPFCPDRNYFLILISIVDSFPALRLSCSALFDSGITHSKSSWLKHVILWTAYTGFSLAGSYEVFIHNLNFIYKIFYSSRKRRIKKGKEEEQKYIFLVGWNCMWTYILYRTLKKYRDIFQPPCLGYLR